MENNKITNQLQELLNTYKIDDLISSETNLVLILESPHKKELEFSAPVSGTAGTAMARKLVSPDTKTPLGRLLKYESNKHPGIKKLGIMNICQFPMQKSALDSLSDAHIELYKTIEYIRTRNEKDHFKESEKKVVQDWILEKFIQRLDTLSGRKLTFVPCGKFAQKFCRLANIDDPGWEFIDNVPHPSYGSWSKEKYFNAVNKVIEKYSEGY